MEEHGLTPAALETQLKNFREGFPFLPVTRAASCGDGIRVLDAAGIEQAAARYDRALISFVKSNAAIHTINISATFPINNLFV